MTIDDRTATTPLTAGESERREASAGSSFPRDSSPAVGRPIVSANHFCHCGLRVCYRARCAHCGRPTSWHWPTPEAAAEPCWRHEEAAA